MTVAEKLYTSGFISYPRTETDIFDSAIDLKALISKQIQHPTWGAYADGLLHGSFQAPRKGRNNDQAHPPIHPVSCVLPTALATANERKVYEYVVRRFLACCSEDARGESTDVEISWGAAEPKEYFAAHGLLVKQRNYLDVYVYDRWHTSEIPEFLEGEEAEPKEVSIHEGETCPPGYLTEPELIGLMDVNGIGTDATMAEHIAKIVEREYVFAYSRGGEPRDDGGRGRGRGRGRGSIRGRARGRRAAPDGHGEGEGGGGGGGGGGGVQEFVPSTLGIALVTGYDEMSFPPEVPPLTKPFLRREMEVKMKGICEGRLGKEEVVRESLEMYREVFSVANREVGKLRNACIRFLTGDG